MDFEFLFPYAVISNRSRTPYRSVRMLYIKQNHPLHSFFSSFEIISSVTDFAVVASALDTPPSPASHRLEPLPSAAYSAVALVALASSSASLDHSVTYAARSDQLPVLHPALGLDFGSGLALVDSDSAVVVLQHSSGPPAVVASPRSGSVSVDLSSDLHLGTGPAAFYIVPSRPPNGHHREHPA